MFKDWSIYAVAAVALVSGCGETAAPPAGSSTESVQMTPAHAEKSKLSPEDQALADKQKNCPVGGEALGSMGTPVKVMVGDRAVFLCCEGCREAIEKDPQKYLAKLDAQAAPAGEQPPAAPAAEKPAEAPASEAPAKP